MILIPYLIQLWKGTQAKQILIFSIQFMYKPIPSKLKSPNKKFEYAKEERSGRKLTRVQRREETVEGRRDPSISRKMEEKYIYNVGAAIRRSSSINGKIIGQTDRLIEEEYHTNHTKHPPKVEQVQQDFLQLGCNSRESYKALQRQPPAIPQRRLVRMRSNDSFSRLQAAKGKQAQNQIKLKSLKDQNAYLKQLHTQSLHRIDQLQQVQVNEKVSFEGEQRVYERQIELLRCKVDRNKVDIGHIFSYETFDLVKLVVKPIIEVEQNSSIMKSLYNNSNIKRASVQCEYGLFQKPNRKIPTETTALSFQNYREGAELF